MTSRIFAMVSTEPSKKYTKYALESFFLTTQLKEAEKLILIDNDGSLPIQSTEKLLYVRPSSQRSFAENVNWIISEARENNSDIYFLNNDIIFTKDWIDPLESATDSIITPVSNREFRYRADGLYLNISCKLDDYIDSKDALEKVVAYHKRKFHTAGRPNKRRVLSLPFFCVKIPAIVYNSLGPLDETFGKGGAEDNDYCLRAYEQGFKVEYALESYLLHFSGKSTWDGAETLKETSDRDERYKEKFRSKWGENLLKLSIEGELAPLYTSRELLTLFQQGQFGDVIKRLKSL